MSDYAYHPLEIEGDKRAGNKGISRHAVVRVFVVIKKVVLDWTPSLEGLEQNHLQ